MRVKLFWKNRPELSAKPQGGADKVPSFGNAQELEDEINIWLSQNPRIKVVHVEQSATGDMGLALWLISVWYEEAA